jgi:hypothetical protein
MRSRTEFIQQETGSTHAHKNESRRPANAGRRLSDLFTPGFSAGVRRFFAMSFAAVYAAEGTAISFLQVPDLQLEV